MDEEDIWEMTWFLWLCLNEKLSKVLWLDTASLGIIILRKIKYGI